MKITRGQKSHWTVPLIVYKCASQQAKKNGGKRCRRFEFLQEQKKVGKITKMSSSILSRVIDGHVLLMGYNRPHLGV